MKVLSDYIVQHREEIFKTYHLLHELAEPSWQEEKTSAFIKRKLENAGLSAKTFSDHFGIVAEIKGETNEVIALRADMDALVQEVDGKIRANHSCGHDAHSTMVLHSALALAQGNYTFKNTIRFIFQPAEEVAGGALKMIENGVLENVKFLGGIHLRPVMELPMKKAAPFIAHGSTAIIHGVIKGVQAHAARPQDGKNPIEAAAKLIHSIKTIELQEKVGFSIKMTELHAGVSSNVIPETAQFTFDLRAETNMAMEELIKTALSIINNTSVNTDTKIEANVENFLPAASRNAKAIEVASNAILSTLGQEGFEAVCVSPGAEDFHFYSLKQPGLAATMIGLGCHLTPGLHHPNMQFNQEALLDGIQILSQLLINADVQEW